MTTPQAAFAFLLVTALLFLCGLLWCVLGPGRYTLLERFLYAPVYLLSRVMWRVELEWVGTWPSSAPENPSPKTLSHESPSSAHESPSSAGTTVPDRDWMLGDRWPSGAVLVANHRCSIDPFFVQLIAGRRVHWMVAGEYFKTPLIGRLLRAFEAIPTNRGGIDTKAIKRAIALAASGRFVGMFPEGRINRTQSPLLSIRPGAATVALRAGVPLVPIWIEGAPVGPSVLSPLLKPAKVRVFVGPPDDWGLQMARRHRPSPAQLPRDGAADPGAPRPSKDSNTEMDSPPSDAPSTSPAPPNGDADSSGVASMATDSMAMDDRAICEAWIHRVMQSSLKQAGREGESIAMAGRNWVQES
jgi:1-acyl-sn-glycerol-3-phosphate acyltransferase